MIKFRAWDRVDNTMVGWEILERASFYELDPSRVLMQFTGLLDKNGKEIYEGDIVLASNEWQLKREVGNQEVFYNSKLAKFDFKNRKGIYLNNNVLQHPQTRLEVIGNIWENPELLKEEK